MKRLTKRENGDLKLRISGRHRKQLEKASRTHKKPQVRERAAAVLKVASGQSVRQVAEGGLLTRRHRSTVYDWIHQYFAHGLSVWEKTRQRQRKISQQQQEKLVEIVSEQSPQDFGCDQTGQASLTLGL